jgi:hypothetical protein
MQSPCQEEGETLSGRKIVSVKKKWKLVRKIYDFTRRKN